MATKANIKKFIISLFTIGMAICGSAQSVSENIGGHDCVDLGLPSGRKWATCNIGANKPTEYGKHFAWGETKQKINYTWVTYKWCENKKVDDLGFPQDFTKYVLKNKSGKVDNKTVLEAADDAATANWGSAWRMPTIEEMQELVENCTWEWTTNYNGTGIAGQIGTSKLNGNTIFLPAAGYRYDSASLGGGYWSSSLNLDYSDYSLALDFHENDVEWHDDRRSYSRSVRAVLN